MNELIKIINQDGQLVVTSRQIAEDFEKEHPKVTRDIENLIRGIAKNGDTYNHLFIESQYKHEQNKQSYKEYLLTRDGFSLLVMGFTGTKALEWKLKYIEAFNKMESKLKQDKPTCIEDVLIQSLQEMKDVKLQIATTNQRITENKQEIQDMRDVIKLDTTSWRKDTSNLINKIALALGGFENIKPIRQESYKLLNKRMGVSLSVRLTNKRRRMADEGVCKSKRDMLSYLDIIADDKKLIEGYIAIVKEMAIKHKVA